MALTPDISCVAVEVPLERRLPAAVVLLFASTLFLSSFLMFLVEPIAAKAVLPLLGGAPMVWNTCVMFFQIVLLAGYAYAHVVNSWLGSRRHTIVYAVLLLVPFATLPFSLRDAAAWQAHGNPIVWLSVVLVSSIGLPFFVLTTTASLLVHMLDRAGLDPGFRLGSTSLDLGGTSRLGSVHSSAGMHGCAG